MEDHNDFFKKVEDYKTKFSFYGCEHYVSAEQLYQAFKKRLMRELEVKSDKLLNNAEIIEKGEL